MNHFYPLLSSFIHFYQSFMIKSPNVAWQFYPEDKQELTEMLNDFFSKVELSPLWRRGVGGEGNLKAIIAPHAGYVYSWPVATYSYQILKNYLENLSPQRGDKGGSLTFVILAPSHYEYFEGVSIGLFDTFETPLGKVPVNTELGKQLIKKHPEYFSFNEAAYEQEHALEVQLPFLQYISSVQTPHGASLKSFQILPMVFGNTNPIEIGNILYELSKKENLFFIVSSDLSHFMSYDNAVKTDEETLQDFVEKDMEKVADEAKACGIHGRLALTQIAIKAKWKPELIKYMNSGDTAGDKSRVVGYWALAYYAK